MAIDKTYITLSDLDENKMVSTKLYIDQYSSSELEKALDIKVTELIKGMPDVNLDLVPKPIYTAEVAHSADLQHQVDLLTQTVSDLNSRIQSLLADSSSLYIANDNLNLTNAKLDNALEQSATTTYELRTNLTTSLTKAINEATERTSLEAENSGLTAQKNALIKQIDTLNNLLAQANATIQVAQQQLSAKAQAVAAGGLSTGELSTLLFDGGDPTKRKVDGRDIMNDFNGGPQGVAQKFSPGGSLAARSLYFDVVAGPKDISVMVECISGYKLLPFDFGFTLPITLKANETKRFGMENPNAAWNTAYEGSTKDNWWNSNRSPTVQDWTMRITVKDIDPKGKSENKDFVVRTHKY